MTGESRMAMPTKEDPMPPPDRKPFGYDVAIALAILAISVLHYVSPVHMHYLHDIYRRLYYLPIIFAAFQHGFLGGLIAALAVCIAYAPHAFGQISHDPATDTQKILEMVLYLAVGITTGSLVSRVKKTQDQLRQTARDLQGSLEQLRSTEEQLVQTAKLAAVGRLSAGLAHEIRNPLASIKGSAEILADDFPPDNPKHRLLRVLVDESARLNHVLTRFLAFARPRPLERQEFSMEEEIAGVVSLLQAQKEGRSVRFVTTPAVPSAPRVRGDREQLRQVLLNVLLNACQAAGEQGEVRIACDSAGGMLRIRVHDSGPGFTKEALADAFTPFFTTKEQGTGLGLAVSHRIVESHGGTIRASNRLEGGGLIEIMIPLQESGL
jgi:two-component system, NtrC family, sensor histidine kinase HydH